MSRYIFDSSVLLGSLFCEPGMDCVEAMIPDAVVSAVNLSEAIGKLALKDVPAEEAMGLFRGLVQEVITFDEELALTAGKLIQHTKKFGLSFGDRACLATAQHLKLEAVTADKIWGKLKLPVKVRVVR